MANTCKTCRHNQVAEINGLLANEIPLWKIVANFAGLSLGGLQRHKENCIEALFAEVREQKRAGLLAKVDDMEAEIEAVQSEFAGNGNVRVQLIARRKDAIDLEAKLTGAYIKDKDNPATVQETAKLIMERLEAKGWDSAEAQAFVRAEYPEAKELGKVD